MQPLSTLAAYDRNRNKYSAKTCNCQHFFYGNCRKVQMNENGATKTSRFLRFSAFFYCLLIKNKNLDSYRKILRIGRGISQVHRFKIPICGGVNLSLSLFNCGRRIVCIILTQRMPALGNRRASSLSLKRYLAGEKIVIHHLESFRPVCGNAELHPHERGS